MVLTMVFAESYDYRGIILNGISSDQVPCK